MAQEDDDIEIRYEGIGGIFYVAIGLAVCAGTFFIDTPDVWAMRGFFLAGLATILYNVYCILDRRITLSLTKEGLKDHRTGVFVKWTDFRGVRLATLKLNDSTSAVTMHVTVTRPEGERELEFDVYSLDHTPETIVNLVQKRGVGALQREAGYENMLADTTADLRAGIPLSFATNKLVQQGLEPAQAAEVVALASNGELIQCRKCQLDYHASVEACGVCGNALSRS